MFMLSLTYLKSSQKKMGIVLNFKKAESNQIQGTQTFQNTGWYKLFQILYTTESTSSQFLKTGSMGYEKVIL